MTIQCTQCNKYKRRITKRINNRNYFYSVNNKIWRSSTICHDCNKTYMKVLVKKERKKRKETRTYYNEIEQYHLDRQCRECCGKLETNRWWICYSCKPEFQSDAWDDYIFENSNVKASELPLLISV